MIVDIIPSWSSEAALKQQLSNLLSVFLASKVQRYNTCTIVSLHKLHVCKRVTYNTNIFKFSKIWIIRYQKHLGFGAVLQVSFKSLLVSNFGIAKLKEQKQIIRYLRRWRWRIESRWVCNVTTSLGLESWACLVESFETAFLRHNRKCHCGNMLQLFSSFPSKKAHYGSYICLYILRGVKSSTLETMSVIDYNNTYQMTW